MDDSTRQIEKALCDAALTLPDREARQAFIAQTCQGNRALREGLEKLLAAEVIADGFFDIHPSQLPTGKASSGPVVTIRAPDEDVQAGESNLEGIRARMGCYQLIERLGEGGCGVVYMAEQQEPVQRKVALKIIRLGMDTERVIARFELERQALALMNHPNIAQVLDAGATETGRPYFAMELVQGVKITAYCDENHQDTRTRLALFIQVCLAIQHAHQKGILHRDIKPSNVMIALQDGQPVPKVIDFGIAKAIEENSAGTSLTIGDSFIGTPAYMSPEQAEAKVSEVDTRTDIYSLGALLYELLTGQPPFDPERLMHAGVEEMRRILRESEPQAPSKLLLSLDRKELDEISARHSCEPSKLLALLSGDLDWIVMKALEKSPQRRYATASGLAADIQRYLDYEPVSARPPSRIYRFSKLVRRNRATFAGIAAVAVALILGLGASTWLFLREREALRRETRLRTEAEKGEKLSSAAFLAREGNFEGANTLLKEIGTPPVRPSLDGVVAYRTVGDWLATQERWQEAAAHFVALIHLDRLDVWDPVTIDYQACGVLLMETGDFEKYARFCEKAAMSYAGEKNGDAAARVLKTCLLRPADADLLKRLQPLGKTTEDWFATLNPKTAASWPAIPTTLWLYRNGETVRAAEGARKAVESHTSVGACEAAIRLILAMSSHRNGQSDQARNELARARAIMEKDSPSGRGRRDTSYGLWWDWVFARVLLREAAGLIEGANPASLTGTIGRQAGR